MSRRLGSVSVPLVVAAVTVVLWQLASVLFQVKTVVLPSPLVIAREIVGQAGLLAHHLWPTFYQTVMGFLLSVAGGILVAVLITYSRIVRTGIYPLIVISQIIPKVSVAPLFVIWFGMGNTSRLLLAFLVAFFPMTINAAAGFQSVEEDYIRMARAYMGSRWQIFAKIRLPHALPYIFSGMKISITLAIIGVVVAEFVASQEGIGYLIVFANGLLDTPLMMAAITVLSLMGLALYGAISALERWAIYWQSSPDRLLDGTA